MKNKKKKRTIKLTLCMLIVLAAIIVSFIFIPIGKNTKGSDSENAPKISLGETKLQETETHGTEMQNNGPKEDPETTKTIAIDQKIQKILALPAGELAAEGMINPTLVNRFFYAGAISDEIFARINGISYTANEHVQISELSYLKMLYYGFDGNTYVGEMIVNQKIEADVLQIFQTLYENQYPIEKMALIDEYAADDEASMSENNTSAFNYRTISGSSKLSNHSYGMAIDLNPKYNPYVKTAADGSIICQPSGSLEYADRSREFLYKIDENDLAYQLFTAAGFTWGGNWNSVKDYQHFEKTD